MWLQGGQHGRLDWSVPMKVAASCVALSLGVMLSAYGFVAAHRACLERRHRPALSAWLEANVRALQCRLVAAVRGTQGAMCAAGPALPPAQEERMVTLATLAGHAVSGEREATVSLRQLRACGVTLRHLVELHDVCDQLPDVEAAKVATDDVWRCICAYVNATLKEYCDGTEVGGDVVVDHAEAIDVLAVAHELRQHRKQQAPAQHAIDAALVRRAERKYRNANSRWRAAVLFVRTVHRLSGWPTVVLTCVLLCAQHIIAIPALASADAAVCVGLGGLSSAVLAQLEHGSTEYTSFALRALRQMTSVVAELAVEALAAVKRAVWVTVMQRHTFLLHTEAILALSLLDFVPDSSWRLPGRVWEALQEMSEHDMVDLDGCLAAVAEAARRASTVAAHPLEFAAGWMAENALDYVRLCRERGAALAAYLAHTGASSSAAAAKYGDATSQRDGHRGAPSAASAVHDSKRAAEGHSASCGETSHDRRLQLQADAVRRCLGALRAGGYEEVLLQQDVGAVGECLRQGGMSAMDAVLLGGDDRDGTVHSRLGELLDVGASIVLDCAATVLPFLAVAATYITRHDPTPRARRHTTGRQDDESNGTVSTVAGESYAVVLQLRELAREHRIFADDICALHLGDVQAPCSVRVAARRLGYMSRSAYRYPQAAARLARLRRAVPRPAPTPATLPETAGSRGGSSSSGWCVTFDHVWFRYPGASRYVLRDISFVADAGTCLGIVGESGSGKSTLLLLAAGLYAPTSGQIRLDGVPLARYPARELRRRIASAWQPDAGPRFFDELSIERNVALGAPLDATPTTVRRALAEAQVLDAVCGRGVDAMRAPLTAAQYSGGELDRLGVARCLVKPAARTGLYLLDEATAALDSVTERRLMDVVRGRRATVLLVSHRLASLRDADALLLLRDGLVVERGRWDGLLRGAPDSYFRTLYDAQRLGG